MFALFVYSDILTYCKVGRTPLQKFLPQRKWCLLLKSLNGIMTGTKDRKQFLKLLEYPAQTDAWCSLRLYIKTYNTMNIKNIWILCIKTKRNVTIICKLQTYLYSWLQLPYTHVFDDSPDKSSLSKCQK